mgnify:CR=1 FL=1
MKKISTQLKTLALLLVMTMASSNVMAGDGTQTSPYTVAELNAQKEALAASGDAVWVKADLKGLGEDGTSTDNATTTDADNKNVYHLAGLFGDANGDTFVAYSWQILGELALSDLTNTKDLLIKLTYQTGSHSFGNTANPAYLTDYEPADQLHFSLEEVHGALSLKIASGLRGYHIPSCFIVPKDVIAVKVSAGYTAKNGAYVNYSSFIGAEQDYVTPKNAALVLMAADGEQNHDFVLSSKLYEQTMSNGNSLEPGKQAGINTGTAKNRYCYRFVSDGTKSGFERNSDENYTVTLASKDEIYLRVSSLANNFYGNYPFETEAKDWITWNGGTYADSFDIFDFQNNNISHAIGTGTSTEGNLSGESITKGNATFTCTDGVTATRYFNNSSKGNHLQIFKNGTFTITAAEGKAVKSVVITFCSSQTTLEANVGTYDAGLWRGNNSSVTFSAAGSRYIHSIEVTTADKDEDTDKTTGVSEVKAQTPVKAAMQGIYDLTGRRISASQLKPGLYIVNGKKVVVK